MTITMNALSQEELRDMLDNFSQGLRKSLDDKLKGLVLFGSYARGDFNNESDVDVLVIVDADRDEMRRCRTIVCNVAEEANGDYDAFLSPVISSYAEFQQYKDVMAFYKNIQKDGVTLIA